MSSIQRDQALQMLQDVYDRLRKDYYDAAYHGIDLDARYKEAQQKIHSAQTLSDAFGVIAWMLDGLNDSHTFFLPPMRPYRHDYGFNYQMVAEHCIVSQVRPQSDAETKGLKPGDEILLIDGYTPSRDTLWKLGYLFDVLRPQPSLQLDLQSPTGEHRKIEVAAKMIEGKRDYRDHHATNGRDDHPGGGSGR